MRKARRSERRCCAWKSMLKSSREGRLLRLELDRPEKRNALNVALCAARAYAIEGAGSGAILLSCAGPSFCSGMDLSEILTPEASTLAASHERLFTLGRRVDVPIV